MFLRVFSFLRAHKKMALFSVLVIVGAGYGLFKKFAGQSVEIRHTLATVERGTLTVSLSGSGQVATSNQIDLKAETSGKVTSLNVKKGQTVKAGTVLSTLDAKDAQKAVRDARINLQSAQLALRKLTKPADSLALLQAQNALLNAQNELQKLKETPDQNISLLQAQSTLQEAKNDLEKLKLSQTNASAEALESKQKAEDNLTKGREDAFNTIADTFLDLPTLITELHDIFYSDEIALNEPGVIGGSLLLNRDVLFNGIDSDESKHREAIGALQEKVDKSYLDARKKYDLIWETYNSVSRYSDTSTIDSLLDETLITVKSFSELAKNEINYLGAWEDYRTLEDRETFVKVDEYQSDLADFIATINSHLSNLLSLDRSVKDNMEAIDNANRTLKEIEQNQPFDILAQEKTIQEKEITLRELQNDLPIKILLQEQAVKEKEDALAKLKAGADEFDLQSQKLSVLQRQNALVDAQEKLADASIVAPFDGIIANIDLKRGQSVSSGSTVFTFIATQYIAEISLNEVDVSKIKLEQKAILNFDAIDGLSLTGQVAEIDTLGTVTQGVVNYTIKIAFDTQDERIKPGMSVSTSIITNVAQDVLLVSTSAIKSAGDTSYVETPSAKDLATAGENATEVIQTETPVQHTVEVGLSNDTQTQVSGDIKVGDKVIVRTITSGNQSSAATTQSQQKSLFSVPGSGGATRGAGAANFAR